MDRATANTELKEHLLLVEKLGLVRNSSYYRKERLVWLMLGLSGALTGYSSPGMDHWYIAWVGLVPLLLATYTSRNVPEAFYRGVQYGFGFTLVYGITILQFTTDVWPDSLDNLIWLANPFIWIMFALQQGALFGSLCSLVRLLPINNGFLPTFENNSFKLPGLLVIPVAWILIFNKLGNSWGSLGFSWNLIEYTQYQNTALLQIAEIIGGIGIGALIVLTNTALSFILLSLPQTQKLLPTKLNCNLKSSGLNAIVVTLIIGACLVYGNKKISSSVNVAAAAPHEMVSLVQGNTLFDAKAKDPREFLRKYIKLTEAAPSGICVWPEWAIPASVTKHPNVFNSLAYYAKVNKQDWVIGCLDGNTKEETYNSTCGIDRNGKVFNQVYHKRFLVPFAEYTPKWILNSPLGALCGTLTPRRIGYSAGDKQTILELSGRKIGPLLCCELTAPELASEATRAGAELLVDCSNTSWFDSKIIGKQCIAAGIFRAIENHRCMVFATTLGPSVIIDAEGRVIGEAKLNTANTISHNLPFYSDITPFARWFR